MRISAQISAMKRLGQGAAAWLIGRKPRSFRASEAPRNRDGSYDAAAVFRWALEQRTADSERRAAQVDTGQKYLVEIRRFKAREAKRRDRIAEGSLVDADDLREKLDAIASMFRAESAAIERAHGHEVGEAIRLMIDRIIEQFARLSRK
jgi:hypothetical protein